MKTIWALNTLSGVVDQVPEHIFVHPIFSQNLVQVEPGTKSYDPEKYEPKNAADYLSAHNKKPEDKK